MQLIAVVIVAIFPVFANVAASPIRAASTVPPWKRVTGDLNAKCFVPLVNAFIASGWSQSVVSTSVGIFNG